MKKEMLIIIALFLGVSFKSYAGTGNTNDGLNFFLVIIGLLLIILGLLYVVDYLQKNGKTMIYKAMSFLDKKITLLSKYLNKVKFEYFDLSYF
jgi:cytochrome c oxidase subunit IV